MQYAIVNSANVVVAVVKPILGRVQPAPAGFTMILTANVALGWIWNGTSFSPPSGGE